MRIGPVTTSNVLENTANFWANEIWMKVISKKNCSRMSFQNKIFTVLLKTSSAIIIISAQKFARGQKHEWIKTVVQWDYTVARASDALTQNERRSSTRCRSFWVKCCNGRRKKHQQKLKAIKGKQNKNRSSITIYGSSCWYIIYKKTEELV